MLTCTSPSMVAVTLLNIRKVFCCVVSQSPAVMGMSIKQRGIRPKVFVGLLSVFLFGLHKQINLLKSGRRNRLAVFVIVKWLQLWGNMLKYLSQFGRLMGLGAGALRLRNHAVKRVADVIRAGHVGDKARRVIDVVYNPPVEPFVGPHQDDVVYPPTSVSFCGCSWLLSFHAGVADAMTQRHPDAVFKTCGASSGSLVAACLAAGLDMKVALELAKQMARDSHQNLLGPVGNMSLYVSTGLDKMLPEDAHEIVDGRLFVSVTRVTPLPEVAVCPAVIPATPCRTTTSPPPNDSVYANIGQEAGDDASGVMNKSDKQDGDTDTVQEFVSSMDVANCAESVVNDGLSDDSSPGSSCGGGDHASVINVSASIGVGGDEAVSSSTTPPPGGDRIQNEIVSSFDSRETLISTLLASCYIPLYYETPTKLNDTLYLDGGLTLNQPRVDASTLTVAPYPGEALICPEVPFPGLARIFPPSVAEIEDMFESGRQTYNDWADAQEAARLVVVVGRACA